MHIRRDTARAGMWYQRTPYQTPVVCVRAPPSDGVDAVDYFRVEPLDEPIDELDWLANSVWSRTPA